MGQCSGKASVHLPILIIPILHPPQTPARLPAAARETLLWVGLWVDPEQLPCPDRPGTTSHHTAARQVGPPRGQHLAKRPCMESLELTCFCSGAGAASGPWEGGCPSVSMGGQAVHGHRQTQPLLVALGRACTWQAKHSVHPYHGY